MADKLSLEEVNSTERVVTLAQVKRDPEASAFLESANEQLKELGYTEHGQRHAGLVANIAQNVLLRLDYPERRAELAAIAAYLHDIGNAIHRDAHASASAIIALEILRRLGMGP